MVSEYEALCNSELQVSAPPISHREWVKALTSDAVVEAIAAQLTNFSRNS
jgi:hypothetical protein